MRIFWVHAINAARFEEGYRKIADTIRLRGRNEPGPNILQLVYNWLCDERKGKWVMILDNADDKDVFLKPAKAIATSNNSALGGENHRSLLSFLPQSSNGSILISSRQEDAAELLAGSIRDIIRVKPMDQIDALHLLKIKLGKHHEESSGTRLVEILEYMPLAITQAAAYIYKRMPRISIATYTGEIQKSDESTLSLLNYDSGDLRRDPSASNSTITTWQISFQHIQITRPSAARLLSVMSHFDRQGIPKYLLENMKDSGVVGSPDAGDIMNFDSDSELSSPSPVAIDEDITTLIGYSMITIENGG